MCRARSIPRHGSWRLVLILSLVFSGTAHPADEDRFAQRLHEVSNELDWRKPLAGYARLKRTLSFDKNPTVGAFGAMWVGQWAMWGTIYMMERPELYYRAPAPGPLLLAVSGSMILLSSFPLMALAWREHAGFLAREDAAYRQSLVEMRQLAEEVPRPLTEKMQAKLDATLEKHPRVSNADPNQDLCPRLLAFLAPKTLADAFVVTTAAGILLMPWAWNPIADRQPSSLAPGAFVVRPSRFSFMRRRQVRWDGAKHRWLHTYWRARKAVSEEENEPVPEWKKRQKSQKK